MKLRFQLVTATQIRNLISSIKALFLAPTFWVPKEALREKCPNTEFFLVRIFLYLDWIRTRKNSVFALFSRIEAFQNRSFDSGNEALNLSCNSKLQTKPQIWIVLASWKRNFYPQKEASIPVTEFRFCPKKSSFLTYHKTSNSKLRFQLVITNQTWSFSSRTEAFFSFLFQKHVADFGNKTVILETSFKFES